MLREDVSIILNEREPPKARIAELLELRFHGLGITSSRIAIDQHTASVVLERRPRILVLDYLLGDFTTGLDILATVTRLPPGTRPRVVLLTDEPSINVAVQALKGGAEDYIEIDSPQAVPQVIALAERILRENQRANSPRRSVTSSLDDLVAVTPSIQQAIRSLRNALTRRERGIILFGAEGTGLTTLAYGAVSLLENPGAWSYIDLLTFLDAPVDLPGMATDPRGGIRPHEGHTAIIDHAENDDGEIFSALATGWSREPTQGGTVLICTTDERTALAFSRATAGSMITVPSLAERRSDIGPLAQRFLVEAESLTGKKIEPLDSPTILELAAKEWPGNVRQLRTVIMNTALDSIRGEERTTASIASNYALSYEQRTDATGTGLVDPLTAAAVFESTGHHYRRTAARLGCSIAAIRRALELNHSTKGGPP